MNIIDPYYVILYPEELDQDRVLKRLETHARTCYKSEGNIAEGSAEKIIKKIMEKGHTSILDHEKISIKVICDRGVTHEWVRHRIGVAYSQESTRYCNYAKEKYGQEITVIRPLFWAEDSEHYVLWLKTMKTAEDCYLELIANGASPQEARSVLPNSLKTEIDVTNDLTAWRWFFRKRCAKDAHPQMRQISIPLFNEFREKLPIIFGDLTF